MSPEKNNPFLLTETPNALKVNLHFTEVFIKAQRLKEIDGRGVEFQFTEL